MGSTQLPSWPFGRGRAIAFDRVCSSPCAGFSTMRGLSDSSFPEGCYFLLMAEEAPALR